MTVLGPVAGSELGVTLPHEHLLIDTSCYWNPPDDPELLELAEGPVEITNLGIIKSNPYLIRDNSILDDYDLMIEEVQEFRRLGGGTIVDVTLDDIGRDVAMLRQASLDTGLHIIAGCGHYVFLAHPAALDDESVDSIAARLISELQEGIGPEKVRPGIIGEIGTTCPLHSREEKVLRAAARAQATTGVALTLHLSPPSRIGHQVLDILESEGANLARVVAGHLDESSDDLDYHRSLADRGCYLEYDDCGYHMYFPGLAGGDAFWLPSDRERARAIAALYEAGYGDRILLSQDVCTKTYLRRFGGHGYGHLLRSFATYLSDEGLGDGEIRNLMVDNPRRMLAGA